MAAQSKSSLPVGRVFEIGFATFTPRITIDRRNHRRRQCRFLRYSYV